MRHLRRDEVLDICIIVRYQVQQIQRLLTLEPGNVFFLLLNLDIIRDHSSQFGIDASLLEIPVQERLQGFVQVPERRTRINALSSPVLLGSLGVGKVGLGEVREILDLEVAVLNDGLDQKGALAGFLDGDVDTGREVGFVRFESIHATIGRGETVLGVLGRSTVGVSLVDGSVAVEILIGQSVVIKHVLLFGQVPDVGDGEVKTDPERVNDKNKQTSSLGVLLLVPEFLREHNFLIAGNVLHLHYGVSKAE